MDWDPEQHMVIMRTVDDWAHRAREAMEEIKAANGGEDPPRIIDAADIAPVAFGKLIEALVALEPVTHRKVGDDLISRAGLVPVDQALGNYN